MVKTSKQLICLFSTLHLLNKYLIQSTDIYQLELLLADEMQKIAKTTLY